MLNAKNRSVRIGNTDMDFVSFGKGGQALVILPGLGDALRTVKGMAMVLTAMYRLFAKDFTVYIFSRKNHISDVYSIEDMADDQAQAMKLLNISNACVMGVSQGGMIAMRLAAKHPELVGRLVLANTAAKCNATMQGVLNSWLRLAEAGDFKSLFIDTAEKTYTARKLRTYRPMYPLLAAMSKPKSLERFIIQASACLGHDASAELGKVQCPTLVIGGDCDMIVGANSSPELAAQIPGSRLVMCNGYGHSAFEEYPGFNKLVLDFLKAEK